MADTDLLEIVTEAQRLVDATLVLRGHIEAGFEASLGKADPETDEEIVPGNGDDYELWEEAKGALRPALSALGQVRGHLAAIQGEREFSQAGVET